MPLPLGSIVRFSAVLGSAVALTACSTSTSTSLAKDPPPAISKELLKSKDNSLLRVAEVARDSADYPSAIRLYKTLVQNGDTRPEVHLGLADCLFLTGAYTEAAAEYHAIDEKSPKIADAEVGLGRVFLAQHKPGEANVEFYGALQHLPGDTRALNGAGVALDNLGRHEDAQLYYQRGIAIAPGDRTMRNNYGLSLALGGDYARAVSVLRPLVDEPGATARNRQNLALALALSGNRAEAEKIARVDLDSASVNNNLRFYEALRATPAATEAALPSSPATPAPSPFPEPAPAPVAAAPVIAAPVAVAAAAPPTVLAPPPAAPAPAAPAPAPAPAPVVVAAEIPGTGTGRRTPGSNADHGLGTAGRGTAPPGRARRPAAQRTPQYQPGRNQGQRPIRVAARGLSEDLGHSARLAEIQIGLCRYHRPAGTARGDDRSGRWPRPALSPQGRAVPQRLGGPGRLPKAQIGGVGLQGQRFRRCPGPGILERTSDRITGRPSRLPAGLTGFAGMGRNTRIGRASAAQGRPR